MRLRQQHRLNHTCKRRHGPLLVIAVMALGMLSACGERAAPVGRNDSQPPAQKALGAPAAVAGKTALEVKANTLGAPLISEDKPKVAVTVNSVPRTDSEPAASTKSKQKVAAIYPKPLRGTWRLGPRPCRLPVNPDGDGRLHINANSIAGYEVSYTPISITKVMTSPNTWRIESIENYLGSQKSKEVQTFILGVHGLTIEGRSYDEKYVKCI